MVVLIILTNYNKVLSGLVWTPRISRYDQSWLNFHSCPHCCPFIQIWNLRGTDTCARVCSNQNLSNEIKIKGIKRLSWQMTGLLGRYLKYLLHDFLFEYYNDWVLIATSKNFLNFGVLVPATENLSSFFLNFGSGKRAKYLTAQPFNSNCIYFYICGTDSVVASQPRTAPGTGHRTHRSALQDISTIPANGGTLCGSREPFEGFSAFRCPRFIKLKEDKTLPDGIRAFKQ